MIRPQLLSTTHQAKELTYTPKSVPSLFCRWWMGNLCKGVGDTSEQQGGNRYVPSAPCRALKWHRRSQRRLFCVSGGEGGYVYKGLVQPQTHQDLFESVANEPVRPGCDDEAGKLFDSELFLLFQMSQHKMGQRRPSSDQCDRHIPQ